MNRLASAATMAVLALTLAAPAANAQIVFSEDFESPPTANFITYFAPTSIVTAANTWSVTAQSVDLFSDPARVEATAFDGTQAVDLAGSPGMGVMETSFPTVPGGMYTLVFHYARNSFIGASVADAQVDVIGKTSLLQATVQHDPGSHGFDTYLQFSDTFVADSSATILRFTGLEAGNAGVILDAISVSGPPAVPAMPLAGQVAVAMALLGAGVAFVSRRAVRASVHRD